jgi:hypothetical protein
MPNKRFQDMLDEGERARRRRAELEQPPDVNRKRRPASFAWCRRKAWRVLRRAPDPLKKAPIRKSDRGQDLRRSYAGWRGCRTCRMTDAEMAEVLGIPEEAVKRLDPARRVPHDPGWRGCRTCRICRIEGVA